MAVTCLMHMKESIGCRHAHLRNSIDYILDIKHDGAKTDFGRLVGGNSGRDHKEILANFMETKKDFNKLDGRQGYHFVISFAKGEASADKALEIIKEFCLEYLGDSYDYVFAVHTDKEHMHGHVVFNSVSRENGYKYHYKKGDWEKIIQPITDKICVEHGLQSLTFDENRKSISYGDWAAQSGKLNWKKIMQADIDYAIQQADSYKQFLEVMQRMNYCVEERPSAIHGTYTRYTFAGEDGTKQVHRSYIIQPTGYGLKDIAERIRTKGGSRTYEDIVEQLSADVGEHLQSVVLKSTQTYRRLYQAVNYYNLPNPFAVPAYQVRHDMLGIENLIAECSYLKEHNISDRQLLQKRADMVAFRIKQLTIEQKSQYAILDIADDEQRIIMEHYHDLQEEMIRAEANRSDKFEAIEDAMSEAADSLPHEFLEAKDRLAVCKKKLSALKKEKCILDRLIDTEQESVVPEVQIKQ